MCNFHFIGFKIMKPLGLLMFFKQNFLEFLTDEADYLILCLLSRQYFFVLFSFLLHIVSSSILFFFLSLRFSYC